MFWYSFANMILRDCVTRLSVQCLYLNNMASGILVNIGSGNGLSPVSRQTIAWTNLNLMWIRPCRTYFNVILFEIDMFSFTKPKSFPQNGNHFSSLKIYKHFTGAVWGVCLYHLLFKTRDYYFLRYSLILFYVYIYNYIFGWGCCFPWQHRNHSGYGLSQWETWCYIVTSSLIGWARTQIDPCITMHACIYLYLSDLYKAFDLVYRQQYYIRRHGAAL